MSSKKEFISFPPGYLGSRPEKFPLIANNDRYFAINKPAGLACFQHEWTLGKPDLSMALRRELLNEKPQLKSLGVEGLFRTFNLDPELSGVLVFAKNEENEELLKNAVGSSQLVFRFHLLVKSETEDREFVCDLPLARHFQSKCMVVSHRTGKKCETSFRFLRSYGQYQLWEAETNFLRTHQIRVHAAERGLNVVGEDYYSEGDEIYLSRIKRDYMRGKGREKPLYDSLCVHLVEVEFKVPEVTLEPVLAPLPSRFETLLKRLDEYRGGRS
ncbi:pseudouridine synthase [Pelagicoccus sp. SDUM812002]|uniref:pseudouridine synthase n=1 Tax=Pelagicoccus sp. SDUM812002 TaxID=3041266 RepID=UPI0028100BED|nr:pseudouridine synthase [Pelagicoccus sp. SDUM812002]MDQ8186106.1 pseudouridine synthase [Pelagicoccus sp. SDUM812002]